MRPKLKIGDRVRLKGKSYYGLHVHGMKGRVAQVNVGELGLVLVDLDQNIDDKTDALVYPHQITRLFIIK